MITNKRIFITGGAGYLGTNIIRRYYKDNEITVYSRDEAKHYYLKKEFPKVKFVVGDVRNYDLMLRASKDNNIGIFAASLKQIEACHDNYEEANKTIVEGAFNSRKVAEDNNFQSACFISSDKSRAATTIYGAMKYVAGESFIANAKESPVNLSTAIYGNVMNSTGSIIPLIWKSIQNNMSLDLYGEEMTRFMLTIDDAIDLIEKSLQYKGVNVVPEAKSFSIKHLFEIYAEQFDLRYRIKTPRNNEKIHEIMGSMEEVPRMEYIEKDNIYIIHPDKANFSYLSSEYSSKDCQISKIELSEFLQSKGFYKS